MALKSVPVYLQLRASLLTEFELSKRLMARYLNKPYEWFVTQNTTDLGKNILAEDVNFKICNDSSQWIG